MVGLGDLVFLELATMVDLGFSASYLSRGRGRGIYTPSRNLTVAAHLVRRLRPPVAETPHRSGNSGYTPEGLLELPTSSNFISAFLGAETPVWRSGDSGPCGNSGVTPDLLHTSLCLCRHIDLS